MSYHDAIVTIIVLLICIPCAFGTGFALAADLYNGNTFRRRRRL